MSIDRSELDLYEKSVALMGYAIRMTKDAEGSSVQTQAQALAEKLANRAVKAIDEPASESTEQGES